MFAAQKTSPNTFELKDVKPVPDAIQSYALFRDTAMPIVIDNGSYQCRAGWATQLQPSLVFKNLIAKQRKERGKKDGETQVGNDIANIEALRFQLKTQFDRNVVTHFEAQETVFDHIFSRLGIDTDGGVYHPIVLTEAFQNPNYSRNLMSELLFECYGVPGLVYGVDSLFSFWHNNGCGIQNWAIDFSKKTGLVISVGYRATHVIPVVQGVVKYHQARRLAVGGAHMSHFLHRLLQLKYPAHFNAITLSRVEELLHEHTYVANNYDEELSKWMEDDVCEDGEGSESSSYYYSNVHRIQLPFVPVSNPVLSVEQQKERRRELAKRLVEMNARKREERLAEDEERLHQLLAAQDLLEEGDEIEFEAMLKECGLSNESELSKNILQLQARIEKTKQKIASLTTAEESVTDDPKGKFYKDSMDPKDYEEWISSLCKQRREILDRQNQRRQRRQDMARRRTVAAQERMRLISELARKEKTKKRAGGGVNCNISGGDTDTFGMRDEDWDVYKAINREGGDSDSEEEHERLAEIEETLRRHDPEGLRSNDYSARPGGAPSLVDPAERHQLHVGVERIRTPEIVFQPHMLGVEQGGLSEVMECVLKQFSPDVQQELANNIFISGAVAGLPGLLDRVKMELQQIRPFGSNIRISKPFDPSLDAWYGARNFALDPSLANYLITRADYEEYGGDYIKEHPASNPYIPSPILIESPCSTIASPSFRLSHCASINESTILSIDSFVGGEKEGSSPFKVSEFPSMMFDLLQEAVILVDDE
ncbi:actin-related protein 5 [Ischnura elegans]|uniref:actin-related protein 5 n=1 Tax=Ischnura elegans TaxID=197161 RepID=UPI001ED87E5E|nr:actin-related protein 5 [Ischnura elegans]XP_046405546.1 actin-related protein 5 [Ischnura elegans]